MKVIFLDIDGVLNSMRSCLAFNGYPWPGDHHDRDWHKFDQTAVGLLKHVVEKTGAVCVLSSSWRSTMSTQDIKELANRLEVTIIGKTRNVIGSEPRGQQIADWLKANPTVKKYAIVDDSKDMLKSQKLIHVNGYDGLSYQNAMDLISWLGDKN